MNVVIIGLGLIGGSYAKAIKKYTPHKVTGIDLDKIVLAKAKETGAIDEAGSQESLKSADIIFLCLYPEASIQYIEQNGRFIRPGTIVTDASGIKSVICPAISKLAVKYNFDFISSHPMAGKEKNGFDVSEPDLFKNASFIVIPGTSHSSSVKTLTDLAKSLNFGLIKYTTVEEHDRMISFTSQLPHVLACAYVLSPNCKNHNGFSAGSYRDVSRVANINAELWSELFLQNKYYLISELDTLIQNINQLKDAVKTENSKLLKNLLHQGHMVKQELGE